MTYISIPYSITNCTGVGAGMMLIQVLASITTARLFAAFVEDAWRESYVPERIPSSLEMWGGAGLETAHGESVRVLDIADPRSPRVVARAPPSFRAPTATPAS